MICLSQRDALIIFSVQTMKQRGWCDLRLFAERKLCNMRDHDREHLSPRNGNKSLPLIDHYLEHYSSFSLLAINWRASDIFNNGLMDLFYCRMIGDPAFTGA